MKTFILAVMIVTGASARAQGKVAEQSSFVCDSKQPAQVSIAWSDRSFQDWAGTVLQAHFDINSAAAGQVSGQVVFTYAPVPTLTTIAIKQSSGGRDLTVSGAVDDFTDVEGRRIIALTPGQSITITMPVIFNFTSGQTAADVMVELEPTEYRTN